MFTYLFLIMQCLVPLGTFY